LQKVPKGVKAGRVDRRLNGRKGFSREEAKNAKALTGFFDRGCRRWELFHFGIREDAAGGRGNPQAGGLRHVRKALSRLYAGENCGKPLQAFTSLHTPI